MVRLMFDMLLFKANLSNLRYQSYDLTSFDNSVKVPFCQICKVNLLFHWNKVSDFTLTNFLITVFENVDQIIEIELTIPSQMHTK